MRAEPCSKHVAAIGTQPAPSPFETSRRKDMIFYIIGVIVVIALLLAWLT